MASDEALGIPGRERELMQVERLARDVFGADMDLDGPILGFTDDDVVAPDLKSLLRSPTTTLASHTENGEVIGFSLAVPIGEFNPGRAAESDETAYIYFTGIEPSRQGEGVVGSVMDDMLGKLTEKGYGFVERDCVIENGYADKVEQQYQGAIVEQYDHTRFPEFGPERFFRMASIP